MEPLPTEEKRSDIVIVGGEASLHYLLQRYAERSGYPIRIVENPVSFELIHQSEPIAVIFPSVENLKAAQTLVIELTNHDIPIIVCSSVFDQVKTSELGADYCLFHPLVYDSFDSTLKAAVTARIHPAGDGDTQVSLPPINPV